MQSLDHNYVRSVPPAYMREILIDALKDEIAFHQRMLGKSATHESKNYYQRKIEDDQTKLDRLIEAQNEF